MIRGLGVGAGLRHILTIASTSLHSLQHAPVVTAAGLEVERPWIADHVHTPAAQEFAANDTRKRPLIFV